MNVLKLHRILKFLRSILTCKIFEHLSEFLLRGRGIYNFCMIYLKDQDEFGSPTSGDKLVLILKKMFLRLFHLLINRNELYPCYNASKWRFKDTAV